jgi:hypothetical protein
VDQSVLKPLMVAFAMIVVDELGESPAEVALAERIIRSRHSSLIDRTKRSA